MGEAIPQVPVATQLAVVMTPTRTSILYEAGPVNVNATYLSPVMVCLRVLIFVRNLLLTYDMQPNDLVQQSFPFSYYYLSISCDVAHNIRVYSDITSGRLFSAQASM